MTNPDELRRLRWHCRRGMKELDLVMLRVLDAVIASGNPDELAAFKRLLATEDPEIWRWVIGRDIAPDPEIRQLLATACDAARAANSAGH